MSSSSSATVVIADAQQLVDLGPEGGPVRRPSRRRSTARARWRTRPSWCPRPPARRSRPARRAGRARASARGGAGRPWGRTGRGPGRARGPTRSTSDARRPGPRRAVEAFDDPADGATGLRDAAWLSRVRSHAHPVRGRLQGPAGRLRPARRCPSGWWTTPRRRWPRPTSSRLPGGGQAVRRPHRPQDRAGPGAAGPGRRRRRAPGGHRAAGRGHAPTTATSVCWWHPWCAATASSSPGWPTTRSSA